MNYKLCEQLKDNGFPFKTTFENKLTKLIIPTSKKIIQHLDTRDYLVRFDDEWFYIPSLSELIETCRIKNKRFELHQSWAEGWYAQSMDKNGYITQGNGRTPKIAVAKLYLKLDKHNKK